MTDHFDILDLDDDELRPDPTYERQLRARLVDVWCDVPADLAPRRRRAVRPVMWALAAAAVVALIAGLASIDGAARRPAEPSPAAPPPLPAPSDDHSATSAAPATTTVDPPSPADAADTTADATLDTTVADADADRAKALAHPAALAAQLEAVRAEALAAVDVATATCMAAKGFTYAGSPVDTSPLSNAFSPSPPYPWNFPAPDGVGYLAPTDAPPTTPATTLADENDAGYQAALYGDVIGHWTAPPNPDPRPGDVVEGDIYDGCYPQALTDIVGGGDPAKAFHLNDIWYQLQDMRNTARAAVLGDPAFVAAEQSWVACMHTAGFDYDGLTGPQVRSWPAPRPTEAERQTVAADVSCRSKLGISTLGSTLFDDALASLVAAKDDLFDRINTELDDIAQRAEQATTQRARTTPGG